MRLEQLLDRDRTGAANGRERDDRSSFGGMAQGGYRPFGVASSAAAATACGQLQPRRRCRGPRKAGARRTAARRSWNRDSDVTVIGACRILGYGEFSGTLGGFGNQRFGSSQDDHYRSWRDRQMSS